MFLQDDAEKATRELNCYAYCKEKAQLLMDRGQFNDAVTYHHNMIRSIYELERLYNKKLLNDQSMFILKQIESSRQHKNLMKRMEEAE